MGSPIATYKGRFGTRQAERLLWRAGFGPRRGAPGRLSKLGLRKAVLSLTRPVGEAYLGGPEPHDEDGNPLAPYDLYGHDHLWWLDRMVRSNQPLIERMTLLWHDWFATSVADVNSQALMLQQNGLFRSGALGSFHDMLRAVTIDPAMLIWLDGIANRRRRVNENYARELMELFTLGPDRGAYTETDVREMARALTGWRATYVDDVGYTNFRFDPTRFDSETKTIFGANGAFGWEDACRLCVEHPLHPSFVVTKLWTSFIPTLPAEQDRLALERLYVDRRLPDPPARRGDPDAPSVLQGTTMVKPPVVFVAGMLRALNRGIDTDSWTWLCSLAGQRLFAPPTSPAGTRAAGSIPARCARAGKWSATHCGRARSMTAPRALPGRRNAGQGGRAGARFLGLARNLEGHREDAALFSAGCVKGRLEEWEQRSYRGLRQNALRQLIFASPDLQTS